MLLFFLLPTNKLFKGRDIMAVPALEELLKFPLVKSSCRSMTTKCLLWLLGIKSVFLIPRGLMVKREKVEPDGVASETAQLRLEAGAVVAAAAAVAVSAKAVQVLVLREAQARGFVVEGEAPAGEENSVAGYRKVQDPWKQKLFKSWMLVL